MLHLEHSIVLIQEEQDHLEDHPDTVYNVDYYRQRAADYHPRQRLVDSSCAVVALSSLSVVDYFSVGHCRSYVSQVESLYRIIRVNQPNSMIFEGE